MGGGTVWPLQTVKQVCEFAHQNHLLTHMDGARLLNAVVASQVPAKEFAAEFDSAWIDFSKGLGAPVGAVLAGKQEFIQEAWQWKQRLGGAMRQAGIVAAAGVFALRHHVDRLVVDHENARFLARGLAEVRGITLNPDEVESNIVIFDIAETGRTAREIAHEFSTHGLRMSVVSPSRLRAVTHLDISKRDVEEALRIVERVLDK
jgi:threonine aldolase